MNRSAWPFGWAFFIDLLHKNDVFSQKLYAEKVAKMG